MTNFRSTASIQKFTAILPKFKTISKETATSITDRLIAPFVQRPFLNSGLMQPEELY